MAQKPIYESIINGKGFLFIERKLGEDNCLVTIVNMYLLCGLHKIKAWRKKLSELRGIKRIRHGVCWGL